MKRNVMIFSVFILFSLFLGAQGKFILSLGGNMLFPSDGQYKDVYGESFFYPEFKLSYKVVADFYLWAGFGFVSASGETPGLNLPADSSQQFYSLGGGYNGKVSGNLELLLELGVFSVAYKEEALDAEESDTAIGFRVDGSLIVLVSKNAFIGVCLGYLTASDTIADVSIKLGGFKGGLCLGVKF